MYSISSVCCTKLCFYVKSFEICNRTLVQDAMKYTTTDRYVKMARKDKYSLPHHCIALMYWNCSWYLLGVLKYIYKVLNNDLGYMVVTPGSNEALCFIRARSPSAYKLLEIHKKLQVFTPGQTVVDLGAAPGAWTQVAVQMTNADNGNPKLLKGRVFAVDKRKILDINGAITLSGVDLLTPRGNDEILRALYNKPTDIVLSDVAPVKNKDNFTGESVFELCDMTLRLAVAITKVNGKFLLNVYDGKEVPDLEKYLKKFYKNTIKFTAAARREGSSEIMILATGFKGLQSVYRS